MKSKLNTPAKIFLIVVAAIFLSFSVLYILDTGITNRMFGNWIYKNFIIEETHWGVSGTFVDTQFNWLALKNFTYIAFIAVVSAIVLLSCLIYYGSAKKKSRQIMNQISNAMRQVLISDQTLPVLPREYDEFKIQLMQLKEMERHSRQLAQAEMQRKNDLITYLAHDLKTPLASVIGYLCLLNEAPDMPETQKEKYTGIALQKTYRLEELINEFFDITRFNLQSLVLNKSKIDLSLMLRQMADEFYPMLIPKEMEAVVHVPENLILTGDADKLARVFNNILKNAIAYSYENSVIDISATQQGQNVVITFTDHGEPIPPQKLNTIFEKFYRLDSSRSSNTGGAGLGLAIAKEIVTAHGGTITAESDAERTVFTVKIPS
ncbi:sensor histidine kinase [Faecalispora jeddahensis]|uniref:sensor histidine kinase n=1 Tax=Faecalispora jeddahensis TaxID=1414721 RepID=UPI0028AE80DB|nr:HAMP domain-containing sensor histidine kinase [Faecalispora jeddahensis]